MFCISAKKLAWNSKSKEKSTLSRAADFGLRIFVKPLTHNICLYLPLRVSDIKLNLSRDLGWKCSMNDKNQFTHTGI